MPGFCHYIFLKSAKFNLSPKSNDKLQIFYGIQIYLFNGYYFLWNQIWLNFSAIKRFVPQCGMKMNRLFCNHVQCQLKSTTLLDVDKIFTYIWIKHLELFLLFSRIKIHFGRCMLKSAKFIWDIFDIHLHFMNAAIKVTTFSFVLKRYENFVKIHSPQVWPANKLILLKYVMLYIILRQNMTKILLKLGVTLWVNDSAAFLSKYLS